MILSETVVLKRIVRNREHYASLGYDVSQCNVHVRVVDLSPQSNCTVLCKCDDCSIEFERRYQTIVLSKVDRHLCRACWGKYHGEQNVRRWSDDPTAYGTRHSGPAHHRWNPRKTEFRKYRSRVEHLTSRTYRSHIDDINPARHPRTLAGVPGGWQLDHIVSIKQAFTRGWSPEQCAAKENLQMLPWEANRKKWAA